jgi:transglutaminase-like putative cysteine protease
MSKRASPLLTQRQFGFVAAVVLTSVLAHIAHIALPVAVMILVLLGAVWLQHWRGGRRFPGWIKLPLVALFPIVVIWQYGNVFGREPGAALACAMLALKLTETERRRDALAIVLFASFVLMSALLFETSLGFTLLVFACIALLLATLRELQPTPQRDAAPSWRGALLQNLRSGARALALAAPLALCAFVFFPRLDSPLWRTPGDASARTGINDSMAPGSIQNLLTDDSAAFRVAFDTAPPPRPQLYWRGPVLTDFDGKTWKRRDDPRAARPGAARTIGVTIGYEVTLEATDKPWLFALDVPLDAPEDAHRDRSMSLTRQRPVTELYRYRANSALRYRLDAQLDEQQRRATLALPAGFNPRSVALAQTWRRDLHDDTAIMRAALTRFHDEAFFYTLSPPLLGRDSVDDFLFGTKRGFCEHYAAAFVFLMRAAQIPARVVTGYQGGYFNPTGDYLLVRQSDAHAWAEIWLDGSGWVRVDPTAAVSPARVEIDAAAAAGASAPWYQASWIRGLRNQFDVINRGWNLFVVQFSTLRQQNLLSTLGIEKADYTTLTWILVGTSTLLLFATALWIMRTPRRSIDALDAAYARFCRKLARAGAARAPAEGPQTYALRLAQMTGSPPERNLLERNQRVQALLADYVSLRYACALPTVEAVAAFTRAVRGLRIKRVAALPG